MPTDKKILVVEEVPIVSENLQKTIVATEPKSDSEISSELVEEKPNYTWIIVPTALLVGVFVGGLITYFSGISKLIDSNISTPLLLETNKAENTPSPSPTVEISREGFKLQILNGSGISGLATKAKIYLEGLGYKDISVGNASSADYSQTEIQIKESKKDILTILKADLEKNYTLASTTATLSASSKFDIIITLGKK